MSWWPVHGAGKWGAKLADAVDDMRREAEEEGRLFLAGKRKAQAKMIGKVSFVLDPVGTSIEVAKRIKAAREENSKS